MGSSAGEIDLDLVINQNNFNRQVAGIKNIAKKAGLAIAAAFSLKKLVDFGKECLELGSDLAEVQNVVDVTFPAMSKQVDEFAQNAAAAFGLSETMAKQFTGTFGAMSKAFGFSEKAAYDMSTTLTGLAGDVASFYNLNQEEAYTKLKSVFTGETESLKDLGVVMTQSALDAYALANGFGKTTKNMSEQEKVALRYRFVLDKLSTASGDFARTSDGWANQTRILKLQFDSLKASIGQGLINVLTPVIKMMNTLLARINQVAKGFSDLTAKLMGQKQQSTGISQAVSDAQQLGTSMDDAASAAQSAAKKIKHAFLGIDEINVLTSPADTGSGDAAGSSDFDLGIDAAEAAENVQKVNPVLDAALQKVKELADIFRTGFKDGLGSDFEQSIQRQKEHLQGIRDNLQEILTDKDVADAADASTKKATRAAGQVAGAAASVGESFSENFLGGIDRYLEKNKQFIKDRLIGTMDASGESAEIIGNFAQEFADVMEVFRTEAAKALTAAIIEAFANVGLTVVELGTKLGSDILNAIIKPFIDNKDALKEALEGIIDTAASVSGTISEVVTEICEKAVSVYDEHFKPLFDSIASGLSDLAGKFLEFWNGNVKPIMDDLAEKFGGLMKEHIQPMISNLLELLGSVADLLKVLWDTVLVPLAGWIIDYVWPVLVLVFEGIGSTFMMVVGQISDLISGLITSIKGIIDFVVGIFTGDWERAWQGVKEIFTGAFEQVKAVLGHALTFILAGVRTNLSAVYSFFETKFTAVKDKVSNVMTTIRGAISNALANIRSGWNAVWNAMGASVASVFNGMKTTIKGAINSILGFVETMANGIVKGLNTAIQALNGLNISLPDWIPEIGGKSFGLNIPQLPSVNIPRLAQGGYVERNTPRLAVIGDNRQYGEIVTPENKMLEVMLAALEQFFARLQGSGMQQVASDSGDIIIPVYIGNEKIEEIVITAQQRRNMRTGGR